ncbi:MAG: TadE/TadG family type IV pilus assembly protein [Novosphingobium sp.]
MAISHSINGVLRALHRFGARLAKNRDGAAAVEFAIVGPAFLALLFAILYTISIYFAQQMLETAAQSAARLLLVGSAQTMTLNGHTGMTAAEFKDAICNGATGTDSSGAAITIPKSLPPLLSCSRLTVNVTTATTYNVTSGAAPTFTYNSSGVLTATNTGYSNQSGGSGKNRILVVQLIYLWPTGRGPLGLNLVNQPNSNRMLVATSVLTTEDYACSSSQTSC